MVWDHLIKSDLRGTFCLRILTNFVHCWRRCWVLMEKLIRNACSRALGTSCECLLLFVSMIFYACSACSFVGEEPTLLGHVLRACSSAMQKPRYVWQPILWRQNTQSRGDSNPAHYRNCSNTRCVHWPAGSCSSCSLRLPGTSASRGHRRLIRWEMMRMIRLVGQSEHERELPAEHRRRWLSTTRTFSAMQMFG